MKQEEARVIVLMGVSGSGKTTIGEMLAAQLDCPFFDGDNYHPAENGAKMATGQPLNDGDREPWLERLATLIRETLSRGQTALLACSALKRHYRDHLRVNPQVQFVFLDGSYDLIWQRMQQRGDHYMKPEMLKSQFAALERPSADEALTVTVGGTVAQTMAELTTGLELALPRHGELEPGQRT